MSQQQKFIVNCVPVYGPNIMSESVVHKWVWLFQNGKTKMHGEERCGRASFVSDDLNKVNERVCENHRFTISELSDYFSEVSRTILHEIVTDKLGYHKFCAHGYQNCSLKTTRLQQCYLPLILLSGTSWKEQIF